MISSERAYYRAMRRMIRCVMNGKNPLPCNPTREDYEILAECINQGYLFQLGNKTDVLRTVDGMPHPTVDLSAVPVKGLAFLRPDRTRLKSTLALCISAIALAISFLANMPAIISSFLSIWR